MSNLKCTKKDYEMKRKIDFAVIHAEECLAVLETLQDTDKYIGVRKDFRAMCAT